MILVLTMAGLYSRFIDEGYKIPKYLLPWGKQTILSKILYEMNHGRSFSDVFLIGNLRDEMYASHIQSMLLANGLNSRHLYFINDTKGQAETAYIGLDYINKLNKDYSEPVVFHNIDTILYHRNYEFIKQSLQKNAGYIDVFTSQNHNYSYVLIDESQRVKEIAEKTLISNIATSGMYGFSSRQIFQDYYKQDTDIYITDVYKKIIAANHPVVVSKINSEESTVVLGTPKEYVNASITSEMTLLI